MTHMRHEVHELELTAPELAIIDSILDIHVKELQDQRMHRLNPEKVAHNHTIEVLNSIRSQIDNLLPEEYSDTP